MNNILFIGLRRPLFAPAGVPASAPAATSSEAPAVGDTLETASTSEPEAALEAATMSEDEKAALKALEFVQKNVDEVLAMTSAQRKDYNKAMNAYKDALDFFDNKVKQDKKDGGAKSRAELLDELLGIAKTPVILETGKGEDAVKVECTIEEALTGWYGTIRVKIRADAEKQEGDQVNEDGTVDRRHWFCLPAARVKAVALKVKHLKAQLANEQVRPRKAKGAVDAPMVDGAAPAAPVA